MPIGTITADGRANQQSKLALLPATGSFMRGVYTITDISFLHFSHYR